MSSLILHDTTKLAIERFIVHPSHALLIIAPPGSGKTMVALEIAGKLLKTEPSRLANHPYFKVLRSSSGKAISIENIRDAIHFTTLKTTGGSRRIVVIEDAHRMTLQAQNALLKTIEEPPAGTVIILTAPGLSSLLPTICSRTQQLALLLPQGRELTDYFVRSGHNQAAVSKALLMSGGLPGLMHALLESEAEHPLLPAASAAREILQKSTFERLAVVDNLAKERQFVLDMLFMMGQMAEISLHQGNKTDAQLRSWHKVLAACHRATALILKSAQPKLVLTNFMLSL